MQTAEYSVECIHPSNMAFYLFYTLLCTYVLDRSIYLVILRVCLTWLRERLLYVLIL